MMVIRKFNYVRFFTFIAVLLAIIIGIIVFSVSTIKKINYKKTYDYKLTQINYSESEIKEIKDKLNNSQIDKLLTMKYDENIIEFIKEKYFIFNNLNQYLEYKSKNKKTDNTKIVSIINTEANIDWFDEERETNTDEKELMLVNRLYGLKEDYAPDDLVDVPSKYAYTGKKISNSILDPIISLIEAGRESGYTFVVSDGYRSYQEQKNIYDSYASSMGLSETDKIVARPGHSEYQTGLSFDLMPYNKVLDKPKESSEYQWLKENAYKYGFIFRFPEDKTDLTGFNAATWRLRYVGTSAAAIIHSENICYEEYYAYFVRGNK